MVTKQSKLTPFGRRVKKKLVDKGMTQTELANAIGCSKQYLQKILTGMRSGEKYVEEICKILKIDAM